MNAIITTLDEVPLGSDVTCQARLTALGGGGDDVTAEGPAIVTSDVAAISCELYLQGEEGSQLVATLTPATTCVLDELVVDGIWSRKGEPLDRIGRNFLYTIEESNFPEAGTYLAVFELALTDGSSIIWAHEIDMIDPTQL